MEVKKLTDVKEFAVSELKASDEVRVSGIAEQPKEFIDKEVSSATFGQKVHTKQYVLKAKVNGEAGYLRVNQGTALFGQLENWIDTQHFELPVKVMEEEVFHVFTGKGQKNKNYVLFDELREPSPDTLFQ